MVKLFVIAGHGAGDSGACGNGFEEAERVRALASKIKQYGGDNVILADFNRNYYADNGISSLQLPKDTVIVELHMDSATPSAKGGHVIIQAGIGGADKYDKNLAELMKKIFPGRSSVIVERNDLANPKRAANRGFNYRLVENGFITNSGDVSTFNSKLDEIAKGYCEAFGISTKIPDKWVLQMYQCNNTNAQKFKMIWDEKREWFKLKSLADGRCVDVKDGKGLKGQEVRMYTENDTDAQLWRMEKCADYFYPETSCPVYLVPKCGQNKCLSIYGYKDENGATLALWDKKNSFDQQWNILDLGDRIVTIITNLGIHRALDVKNGGK